MEAMYRKLRVFVASPSDVQAERDHLARVITEINHTLAAIAPEKRLALELVRWETHVAPSIGPGPQPVVNEQVGEYDIFIGILWKRMGTPTDAASSGTEEEFDRAYDRWQRNRSLPILFYFCQRPFPPPSSVDEVDQLRKVVAFRNKISTMGITGAYDDHDTFADEVRPHLLLHIGRLLAPNKTPLEALYRLDEQGPVEASGVRQQIVELAQEYERIRRDMVSGDARTRRMEVVASRMRSLALTGHTHTRELIDSRSPGVRLAAIMMLQSVPQPEFLSWLARRLGVEKPFVGYHAAQALLAAVRLLKHDHEVALGEAIATAKSEFLRTKSGDGLAATDRYRILEEAERELADSRKRA